MQQTDGGTFWLPPQASVSSQAVDWTFYFVYWLSVFFFVLIVTLMVAFVIMYRRRDEVTDLAQAPKHHTALEVTWTVIPLVLVLFIFYFGFKSFMDYRVSPQNSYEILVTGQKWKWFFTYPNGYVSEDLHVPLDQAVKLTITSSDVTHSLFIPAFRLKMDAVPGRYTDTWFQARQEGNFQVFCAEYCGTSHSDMLAMCVVHPRGDFEKWLQEASNFVDRMPPAEAGERLYNIRGCKQCHSLDGTVGHGPSFEDLYGTERPLQDGSSVVADDNYIRESLMDPNAKIRAGFEAVMPTFQGKLKDKEVTAIIAFIKAQSQYAPATEVQDATGTVQGATESIAQPTQATESHQQ
jgi:cytochrome c oxidase subunit 2